jgi:hypothetical protein
MVTKKKGTNGNKKSSGSDKNKGSLKKMLVYGGLSLAAIYAVRRIPFVRNMAIPILATAITKNFGSLKGALTRA